MIGRKLAGRAGRPTKFLRNTPGEGRGAHTPALKVAPCPKALGGKAAAGVGLAVSRDRARRHITAGPRARVGMAVPLGALVLSDRVVARFSTLLSIEVPPVDMDAWRR